MKNKIASLLKHDKLIHFFVGFIFYVGFEIFFSIWISLLFTFILAIANEIRDEYKKRGAFDWIDILFTVAPGGMLILTNLI